MAAVEPRHRAVCWAPLLSGCRPGELFAMDDDHLDRDREMIYLHQTMDRYGHLMNGLKGTHHIADESKRGRWTLFPKPLIDMLELRRATDTDVPVSVAPRQVLVGPQLLPQRVGTGASRRWRLVHALRPSPHVLVSPARRRYPARRGLRVDGP